MRARLTFTIVTAAALPILVAGCNRSEEGPATPPSTPSAEAKPAGDYPEARFPSYLKPPKAIENLMPFARAAVRQTGGRTQLGLVEKGMVTLMMTEGRADPMVMQVIKRAYEERDVKVYLASEHELLGVNKEDALPALASRFGDLNEALSEDWIAHITRHQRAGKV